MKKIRLSLDLTPAMKDILEKLAEENGVSQGEVLRFGIALYKAVKDGQKQGEYPAMLKDGKAKDSAAFIRRLHALRPCR